jgi:hypothetical protein
MERRLASRRAEIYARLGWSILALGGAAVLVLVG